MSRAKDDAQDPNTWVSLKIRLSTQKELLQYQSILQLQFARKFSIDDVIKILGTYAPAFDWVIEQAKENKMHDKKSD